MSGKRLLALLGPQALAIGDYYNQMALRALVKTSGEFGFEFDVVISPKPEAIAIDIESCAKLQRYDLIIAVGNAMQNPLGICAQSFPGQYFALVDGSLEGMANVVSYSSNPREISFLCGQVATRLRNSNAVGCILWSDNWVAREWIGSFTMGAKSANPRTDVFFSYAPSAEHGYQKALAQYRKGVEVIMCHAGSSDLGILKAGRESSKYALGFLNERGVDPDHVLFDVVRNMYPIFRDALGQVAKGEFRGGRLTQMGLKEKSFALDLENAHPTIGPEDRAMIEGITDKIRSGQFDSQLANFTDKISLTDLGGILV